MQFSRAKRDISASLVPDAASSLSFSSLSRTSPALPQLILPSGHAPDAQNGPHMEKSDGASRMHMPSIAHASARISHCALLQQRRLY